MEKKLDFFRVAGRGRTALQFKLKKAMVDDVCSLISAFINIISGISL